MDVSVEVTSCLSIVMVETPINVVKLRQILPECKYVPRFKALCIPLSETGKTPMIRVSPTVILVYGGRTVAESRSIASVGMSRICQLLQIEEPKWQFRPCSMSGYGEISGLEPDEIMAFIYYLPIFYESEIDINACIAKLPETGCGIQFSCKFNGKFTLLGFQHESGVDKVKRYIQTKYDEWRCRQKEWCMDDSEVCEQDLLDELV